MARRLAAPLSVAVRRLAARPGSALLAGFGIALATGALATLLVSQTVVEDRAVADAIGRLPAQQRVVSVSWVGIGTTGWPELDRAARRGLASLEVDKPMRAASFRSTRLGTEIVRLAAVEDPGGLLELRTGRLPSACTARRCEVVALDGPSAPLADSSLAVVGSATARPGSPLAALVGSTATAERVLVGVGIDALSRRPEVSGLFRTLTWAAPLDVETLDSRRASRLPLRIAEVDTALQRTSSGFAVNAPIEDLEAARERAERASARQLLVGGQFVVVFLAFTVLAASRLRRSARETAFRLRRLRAVSWQISLETVAHAVAVAVPAVFVGVAAGLAGGALIADAAGRPAGDAVERAFGSRGAVWLLVLVALGAVAILVATARARTLVVRGRGLTAVDVAAGAAVAAVGAVLLFGETDVDALSRGDGSGATLLLLPVLVALAAGLLAVRGFPFLLRAGERAAAAVGAPTVRLALLSVVRNPGIAAVTVACLTVTVSMAVFALAYGATLAAGQRDAAAYAVPLDYVVSPDVTRIRAGGTADLAPRLGGALGVVRRSGEAPTLNRRDALTVLGLPREAFARMAWRGDYAARPLGELGRSVRYEGGGLRGAPIPANARQLVLPRVVRGDPIRITAQIRRLDGGFSPLDLTRGRAAVPAPLHGGTLVGLILGFPPAVAFTAAHRATGRTAAPDVFLRGTLTLGRPRVQGGSVLDVDYRDWVLSNAAGTGGSKDRFRIDYLLSQERVFRLRPRQPTDEEPIPVIASSSLSDAAGSERVLPVRVGGAEVEVRIAAVARRFPTLSGDFLVADRGAVETAANASVPGAALADEAWLEASAGAERRLRGAAPFPVRIASRRALEESLRSDPVSRAASIALLSATLLAAGLALAGLLLAVVVDARDDSAALFELESLGYDTGDLARHLWLRSAAVLAAGLLGGLATGALASLLVTDVVAVTANVTPAEPPLVTVLPWGLLAAALVASAILALVLVGLLARRPFRAPAPARPEAA
jgi:hypothetical protein